MAEKPWRGRHVERSEWVRQVAALPAPVPKTTKPVELFDEFLQEAEHVGGLDLAAFDAWLQARLGGSWPAISTLCTLRRQLEAIRE